MIYIDRWKVILVIAVCALGLLYSLPNMIGQGGRDFVQNNMPSFFPQKTINLGLDLQGGSHLLLQVETKDIYKERAENIVDALRSERREGKIQYRRVNDVDNGVILTLKDEADAENVRKVLRSIERELLIDTDGTKIEAKFSDVLIKQIEDQTINQSIEIVRRRIDETGTREPAIQRQGDDRILVQLPGLDDPQQIKDLLGKTAKLTFHLVDAGQGGGSTMTLPMAEDGGRPIEIFRKNELTGDMLTNASFAQDQNGRPAVGFQFNTIGAKKFCKLSRENSGKPFAIVLDGEVISAPRINEPICGGQGIISGTFSIQEVNDLSMLLRAGALPAPLSILEERSVGPSLGADSVQAGKIASMIGLAGVLVFMLITYKLFGVFASVALIINVALIFAILSSLQATLTLPGIAGIVLTIGMAVDANVLIFERIKEELKNGRTVMSAVDVGFSKAMGTIIDSNLTTLIAALILYSFGTGPIKGFSVTLAVGIMTSFFSAIFVTRLLVVAWLHKNKPTSLKL